MTYSSNQKRRLSCLLRNVGILTLAFLFGGSQAVFGQCTCPWNTSGGNVFFNTGKVGVGTSTPTGNSLHVFASDLATHNDILGINQPAGLALDVQTSSGTPPVSGAYQGFNSAFLVKYNPGGSITGNYNGLRSMAVIDSSVSTSVAGAIGGLNGQASHNGSGSVSIVRGAIGLARNGGLGTILSASGIAGVLHVQGSGNITSGFAVSAESPIMSGTGIVSTAYGVYANPQKVTGVTTGYGFFQAGVSDINYFAGNTGFGTSAPAARLHLAGPAGFAGGIKLTNTDAGGRTFSMYPWTSGLIIADETVSTVRMAIDTNGNVGIGTSTPSAKLHVAGDAAVSGNVTVTGNIAAKYQDVAEWVPSRRVLSYGTVVVIDSEIPTQVVASSASYDTRVAGVISEMPGLLLGEKGEGKVMVATTGRVKVKVDATKRPIRVGDLLVTSDKEGFAMRSDPIDLNGTKIHRPGTIIGKALEPLNRGVGEILVLLSMQ